MLPSELSSPSPHCHRTTPASPGTGSESTATPRMLPPLFLMHSPHGANSAYVTPHTARTTPAAVDLGDGGGESGSTPAGDDREAAPSPHGPMNGGRAPRSSPAAEPGPSPQQQQQQRASPHYASPPRLEGAGGAAHAPRVGLATAKSAPVHGSPPVAGGVGHEGGQEEGASVRRERRRRSEALARVDEEDAAEPERPAAPSVLGGPLRLLTEDVFLASSAATATDAMGASLAQEDAAAEAAAGGRAGACQAAVAAEQRLGGACAGPDRPGERPRSAAGGSSDELAHSPSGSAGARRTSEAAGTEAAADTAAPAMAAASAAQSSAPCVDPVGAVAPSPPHVQPIAAAVPSPLQATPQRSPQPPRHAWPAAAVAAARGSRPSPAQPPQPPQQPSRSPAAPPRGSGTPAAAQQLEQPRPSPGPGSRQLGPSAASPVAAPPARRTPSVAASPAAAPARSPAPGPTTRGGAAAASANPFASVYSGAASGRLRSTPPPPHAFSMHASASTRLALQDVLSSRRSVNRGGGFSSSMSVNGLGGNIDFRPKWRF
ncbi:hypothetical protein HXX76_006253 [Chlamydomonas incerta]|uniref:Uncharacterized protein n=1 Tax=Chlamydomonas incerta TaxID=51695 RepID=A0A835TAF5_CHLIN|nr:hypothetical protein HXX76_006253 [Chlamydomonas incerta]|eukprot:KAG2436729.1 hypothetical protein HXX76_006253 [Chlamydomonas incerta]